MLTLVGVLLLSVSGPSLCGVEPWHRWSILVHLRLPRTLLASLSGAALAVAGAAVQSLFRTPLATPDMLGVAGTAYLACGITLLAGAGTGSGGVQAASVLSGMVSACAVLSLLWRRLGEDSERAPARVMLLGLSLNAVMATGSLFLTQVAAQHPQRLVSFLNWSLSGLAEAGWGQVLGLILIIGPVLSLLLRHARDLERFSMYGRYSSTVGTSVDTLQRRVVLGAGLSVGATTAFGVHLPFLSLLVPHLARRWSKGEQRHMLRSSAMIGGLVAATCDSLARTVAYPHELPAALFSSLVGLPILIHSLRARA